MVGVLAVEFLEGRAADEDGPAGAAGGLTRGLATRWTVRGSDSLSGRAGRPHRLHLTVTRIVPSDARLRRRRPRLASSAQ